MGYVNKGLQSLQGRPLVAWILERLAPQVDALCINANQDQGAYAQLGAPYGARVIADVFPGQAGPLAGLQAALHEAQSDWVLTVPCDSPFLPLDLAVRLLQALRQRSGRLAFVTSAGRQHPVFCLCHRDLLTSLTAGLQRGERRLGRWLQEQGGLAVPFDEQADAFDNINTLDELNQARAQADLRQV